MAEFVIIGSGVAGIAAAQVIRRREPHQEIMMIGDEAAGYYSRPGLAYYLSGEIPEKHIFPFSESELSQLKLRRRFTRVEKINPREHCLNLASGEKVGYGRLLLAIGASAARPDLPGVDLEGVVTFDSLDDTNHILHLSRRAKRAVVVGGGITALELAEGFHAHKLDTHYLLRGDRYWRNVLDPTESQIVISRLRAHGVHIHYKTELKEILGRNGKVQAVRMKDDRVLKCQLVAFAIGVRPRIALADQAGLETDRGILVNEFLQTTHRDIYAAGDVAQVFDPFTGKSVINSLWGPAREEGRIAGLNMTGKRVAYHKGVSINLTRLAGLTTAIIGSVGRGDDEDVIGIVRGDSESWRQLPDALVAQNNFDINRLRIMIQGNRIIGALIMGDQTLVQPLYQMIRNQMDVSPIRDLLLHDPESITNLLSEFWSGLSKKNGASQ